MTNPCKKKSQALNESEASAFGIDISRDVLRAVTGSTKSGINFRNVSGGDAIFSFGINLEPDNLVSLCVGLASHYSNNDYKTNFSWVDNVRKVKQKGLIEELDTMLLGRVTSHAESVSITIPEVASWDTIEGFSFTRSKNEIFPTIEAEKYLGNIDADSISIESIKRDRLFVHATDENIAEHSVYKCLYTEISGTEKNHMIFGGMWYEIDKDFMTRVNAVLDRIKISSVSFPPVEIWTEDDKEKIEHEGDYNERVSLEKSWHLLDKKLIKSNKTTSSIELCDLLTPQKQFIHVKHRKGGSAGLSHLFAQGSVSAELILGDKEFRKASRTVLKRISDSARDMIPLSPIKSNDFEIVYLILGDTPSEVKDNLPFFSKVNLSRAYESLSQRGFSVKMSAAIKSPRA